MAEPDSPILERIDRLLDETADAHRQTVVSIVAEVERSWVAATESLTAAVDYAALSIPADPTDEEVEEVENRNAEAAAAAAFLMMLFLGSSEPDALAIIASIGYPAALGTAATLGRLRLLRSTVNAAVNAEYAKAIQDGLAPTDALSRATQRALVSTGLYAEAEALSAVNTGINALGERLSLDQLVVTKTWYTRRDDRVREAHAKAEGQEVPQGAYFSIGGWPMEFPGDTRVPPSLWMNCRCIMVLGSPSVTTTTAPTP